MALNAADKAQSPNTSQVHFFLSFLKICTFFVALSANHFANGSDHLVKMGTSGQTISLEHSGGQQSKTSVTRLLSFLPLLLILLQSGCSLPDEPFIILHLQFQWNSTTTCCNLQWQWDLQVLHAQVLRLRLQTTTN